MTFDPRISLIAMAIAQEEGYFLAKSSARRHNNPGNLRLWPNTPVFNGFAHFKTPLEGWTALLEDIQNNAHAGLASFLQKYAPPGDRNNTSFYISLVSSLTGFGAAELIGGNNERTNQVG